MKTIFLLMDSLNRHYLSAYGDSRVHTPNLDRLAQRGVVFDQHWTGSLPCIPARREMMTGRLNFLETGRSAIQPWDDCLPVELRRQKGTYSHIITDHYHYFRSGGEGYHTLFDTWEFERGQESDKWHALVNDPPHPDFIGRNTRPYWANRSFMDTEDDLSYSTPRCFLRAIDFLEHNYQEDNWLLQLEVFDPHEPFACPQKYLDLYGGSDWDGPFFNWPNYAPVDKGLEGEKAIAHIRKCFAATLTMADTWLGKFLDKMDELDLWKDTTLILTADHGQLLGEHGYWAKDYTFVYQELAHIPLIVCTPETAFSHRRVSQLTATMDIMPTILSLYDAQLPEAVQGQSILPLLHQDQTIHDALLFGYFGMDINLYDGRYTYCRQPLKNSIVYNHTAMPTSPGGFIPQSQLAEAQTGVFLKHCHQIPHFRIPQPSRYHADAPNFNPIYDLQQDPAQTVPIHDTILEKQLADKMVALMHRFDAPDCQYRRMGF